MSLGTESQAYAYSRRAERDDVDYRALATTLEGSQLELRIVNISSRGLMACCDEPLSVRNRIRVTLPQVGAIEAEIRWALGGRLGCEFIEAIGLASYYDLLAGLVRGK